MKNETHEDRVKILSEAPEGSSLIDLNKGEWDYVYVNPDSDGGEKIVDDEGLDAALDYGDGNIRSLADIQKQVDMQNEIDKWHNAYLTAMNELGDKQQAIDGKRRDFQELEFSYFEVEKERLRLRGEIDSLKVLLSKAGEQIYNLPDLEKEIMDAID